MNYVRLTAAHMSGIARLHRLYKAEIGEAEPSQRDLDGLMEAIAKGRICFYGAEWEDGLVGMCSVCTVYSTFNYAPAGLFEDFYVLPEYRHRGIARKLANFAYKESGVSAMLVGCADCDVEMYVALGFDTLLGNMLARNH